jgi:hypothetical protein
MKKFGVCTILSIGVFCALLLLTPLNAYADTVTIQFTGPGGPNYGSPTYYVYPYNFSINGSTSITPLMCLSYASDIGTNETWTATTAQIAGNPLYEEAAYIFSLTSTDGAVLTQWADWALLYPSENQGNTLSVPAAEATDVSTLLTDAADWVNANPDSPIYSDYVIYVPVKGSQSDPDGKEYSDPQYLIGGGAPEPSSFILLGSGLLGLAAFFYGRKRKGLKSF